MINVKCKICGKIFQVKPYLIRQGYGKFCSSSCYGKWQSGKKRGNKIPRIKVKCSYCGKEKEILPNLFKRSKHFFCNRECVIQWQREVDYLSGDKNPSWLGGHKDYRGENWRRQRRRALKRDNYTCQKCGTKENLTVYHKYPYHLFDHYKKANRLNNLKTLCNKCHGKEEIKFWKEHPELKIERRYPLAIKEKKCLKCGKIFEPNSNSQKVCTQCYTFHCLNCNKIFIRRRNIKTIKFCSRKCHYEYTKRNNKN